MVKKGFVSQIVVFLAVGFIENYTNTNIFQNSEKVNENTAKTFLKNLNSMNEPRNVIDLDARRKSKSY